MKLHSISNFIRKRTFNGTPEKLYTGPIRDYHDALSTWENLKYAKYLDVHSDKQSPVNKDIRLSNYSFLDKLSTQRDKSEFINAYCVFTKFPDLKQVAKKMEQTFETCLQNSIKKLQTKFSESDIKILTWGYDPTCSLGLQKAFPGSDLDKGYVILSGNRVISDEKLNNEFKGELWHNLDQRIVSLNHPDTFPEVCTDAHILSYLNELNDITNEMINEERKEFNAKLEKGKNTAKLRKALAVVGGIAGGIITGNPIVAIGAFEYQRRFIKIPDGTFEPVYTFIKNSDIVDPYEAAEFNRNIAKRLANHCKEDVKNFSFFIETLDARRRLCEGWDFYDNSIRNSSFVKYSNVNQTDAWYKRIANGYLKSKLRNRIHLENDFYRMTTDEKYDLIKDIIKSSSNDQSSKYSQYFKNDDDIKNRYDRLLNALVN